MYRANEIQFGLLGGQLNGYIIGTAERPGDIEKTHMPQKSTNGNKH